MLHRPDEQAAELAFSRAGARVRRWREARQPCNDYLKMTIAAEVH